ncbi:phosphoinositide 3-kinase adapter protein 1-like [Saccostrea echinata]|uniref:phosphoinositide 3-kinase adapter protein 1-like n=1 Tax=Saccostrea echinata TaxID=191078 RepID=UPI002A7FABB0|nr:phosphoinositide 3-kinase adapter protein 1-like [Saccostrea echinata]
MAEKDDTYSKPWRSDEYVIAQEKLDNSIFIIHTHESEPIAVFLKENLEKFHDDSKITVNICDVTEIESRNLAFHAAILLLTPEMIFHLESMAESPCSALRFHPSTICVFLIHEPISMDDERVSSVLKTKLPDFNSWKILKLTQIRSTLIQILHLLEEEPSSLPRLLQYSLEPSHISTDRHHVLILFKTEKEKSSMVVVHTEYRKIDAKYQNPYTFSFSPYGLLHGQTQITVFVNGKNEGSTNLSVSNKLEFLYKEMDDIISPVEFLCQVLKLTVEDRETLDRELSDRINNDVFSSPCLKTVNDRDLLNGVQMNNELPTMLHFGAKYGLSQFCKAIKGCRGFESAITTLNKDNENPCQLAKRLGYLQLSRDLDPLMLVLEDLPLFPKNLSLRSKNILSTSAKETRSPKVTLQRRPTDIGRYFPERKGPAPKPPSKESKTGLRDNSKKDQSVPLNGSQLNMEDKSEFRRDTV